MQDTDRDAVLRVIAFCGPNGSGKSTINAAFLSDPNSGFKGEYVNADDISKELTASHPDPYKRNVAAAEIAEQRRIAAMNEGRPFAFETVMSTPAKVALLAEAKARGFDVTVVFVTTDDPQTNVTRVAHRVATGGHPVDPAAVVKRYHATMGLLPSAIEHADRAYIFDNSYSMPRLVATKEHGHLDVKNIAEPPAWVQEKLVLPLMAREKSMATISAFVAQIDLVKPPGHPSLDVVAADAANGTSYAGKILAVTEFHALQQVGSTGKFVIHDLTLLPKTPLSRGQDTSVAYAYDKGKIVEPPREPPRQMDR